MSKGQYVCQRAAHAIIAEIGQLRVSGDALGAINLFIDEFISLLITSSCSIDLVRLKSSVLQLLPHSLGKNALVEAEIELKQQVEQQHYDFTSYEKMRLLSRQEFQCNEVIPVLQTACTDYCTLTSDDNNNTRTHTNDIHIPPVVVIYVTAIVEHVAEYLLNSVAMTADQVDAEHIRVKEVLVTLLDDPQVNSVFKSMNLKEKLEKRVSTFPTMNINSNYHSLPTPSPSPISTRKQPQLISRHSDYSTRDPDLSFNEFLDETDDNNNMNDEPRVKVDSSISSIRSSESIHDRPLSIMSNGTIKSSGSKSRFNFFNSNKKEKRTSISLNFSSSSKRQPTMTSPTAPSFHSNTSSPVNTDFDDLIRSGKTKKVTLTPNRLKSIEVKKEQQQRHDVTPWESLPTPTKAKTKKRSTMLDTSPPPPLPPLPRLIHRDNSQQQVVLDTNSPPLTPASSVASRPSQRSRHSIIYEESSSSMKSSHTNESLSLELQRAPSKMSLNSIHSKESVNNKPRLVERPSSMVVKRASMGSRPPSFHENVLFMDNSNHMLMAAAAAGSVAVEFDHLRQDYEDKRKSTLLNKSEDCVPTNEQSMIYVVPTSTTTIHHKNNNNKLRSMDRGCQTEPIALHTLIHHHSIHKEEEEDDEEAEEEWFIEEEDWEDHPSDEEKCVVEWLLGNA